MNSVKITFVMERFHNPEAILNNLKRIVRLYVDIAHTKEN